MILRALTWSRDSHGLFDFESKHINKQHLTLDRSSSIHRFENDVGLTTDSPQPPSGSSNLCRISFSPALHTFSVSPTDSEEMWLVVRTVLRKDGHKGYTLSQGDILKLGRIKYKVKELISESSSDFAEKSSFEEYTQEVTQTDSSDKDSGMCRICLCETSESENPLVSPCSCSGTMKYIHIQCLQKWILSRIVTKVNDCNVSYQWKAMICELCKHNFPQEITVQQKKFEVFSFEKPKAPYLVLESLSRERSNTGLLVISMHDKKVIHLGRGHDSDIRISDISVSRLHAHIHYRDGMFILEDNDSKFGTLIQMHDSVAVTDSKQLSVQIGRTVLTLAMKNQQESLISTGLLEGITKENQQDAFRNVFNRTIN